MLFSLLLHEDTKFRYFSYFGKLPLPYLLRYFPNNSATLEKSKEEIRNLAAMLFL